MPRVRWDFDGLSYVNPIGNTKGIVGLSRIFPSKIHYARILELKMSWGLIFSGYEVLLSTTTWYNMSLKLPRMSMLRNILYFFENVCFAKKPIETY